MTAERLPIVAAALILAALIAFPAHAAGSAADRASERAVACLLRDLDGGRFADSYLSFEYPGEHLPPTSVGRVTYRRVDAWVVLALIGRAGPVPDGLEPEIERARAALRESAGLWLGLGFNNTLANRRPEGVGLDTYCTVGWLEGSRAMADEVAASLVGDRWMPEGWYEVDEDFRATADESWCVRLLSAHPGAFDDEVDRVLERLATSEAVTETGRFYDAWHLAMVATGLDGDRAEVIGRDALATLEGWAAARSGDETGDRLEWANLAAADFLSRLGEHGARLRDRAIDVLLHAQGDDGCWVLDDAAPTGGRSFLTLRALLALQRYRRGTTGSRNPAP